ncbi:MAG: sulfotransferase [Lentisphaerae bacterium]|nr:sulfotransferase [Lentisphaerota bacterium]
MSKHIHIVACSPRSGTTLLHEAMITCFKHDKHYDHEMRFNKTTIETGTIVITKRPKDTPYMLSVLEQLSDLYVIYMLRDPRDVIVSRHSKDMSKYYSNIRLWNELHSSATHLYGHNNFLQIKYEDFVTDPDQTQREICARFPWLESVHKFSEFHNYARISDASSAAMHSVRPIDTESIGVWKKHPGRILAQQMIHGSLTPILIECGYETSGEWEKLLNHSKPDLSKSYYPEKESFPTILAKRIAGYFKVQTYISARKREHRNNGAFSAKDKM